MKSKPKSEWKQVSKLCFPLTRKSTSSGNFWPHALCSTGSVSVSVVPLVDIFFCRSPLLLLPLPPPPELPVPPPFFLRGSYSLSSLSCGGFGLRTRLRADFDGAAAVLIAGATGEADVVPIGKSAAAGTASDFLMHSFMPTLLSLISLSYMGNVFVLRARDALGEVVADLLIFLLSADCANGLPPDFGMIPLTAFDGSGSGSSSFFGVLGSSGGGGSCSASANGDR